MYLCGKKVSGRHVTLADDRGRPLGYAHEQCFVFFCICGNCLEPLAGESSVELTDAGIAFHSACPQAVAPEYAVVNPGMVHPQVLANRENIAPLVAAAAPVAISAAKKYGPGIARAAGKAVKKALKKKKRNTPAVWYCPADFTEYESLAEAEEIAEERGESGGGCPECGAGLLAVEGMEQAALKEMQALGSGIRTVEELRRLEGGRANTEPGRGVAPPDPYLAQMMIEEAEEPEPLANPKRWVCSGGSMVKDAEGNWQPDPSDPPRGCGYENLSTREACRVCGMQKSRATPPKENPLTEEETARLREETRLMDRRAGKWADAGQWDEHQFVRGVAAGYRNVLADFGTKRNPALPYARGTIPREIESVYPFSKIVGRMKREYGPRRGREVFYSWLRGVSPKVAVPAAEPARGRRR